jgi:transcriptional regulator with XRE-family HTH domain
METLARYIKDQMDKRGWSQHELARQAEIAQSSVRRAVQPHKHKSPAGLFVLTAIAEAFKIHPTTLLEEGELIEPRSFRDSRELNLAKMFRQCSESDQDSILKFTEYLFTSNRELFPPSEDEDD